METKEEEYIYELIDIEWSLNYDISEPPIRVVYDGERNSEEIQLASDAIIYDEAGIPMGVSPEEIKIRRQLIFSFYEQWKEAHPRKAVYNESLKSDILIRQESVVEVAEHASKRYTSTLAVFRLDEVLAKAVYVAEDRPKSGNKNQAKLAKMLILSLQIADIGIVKLTVGVRRKTLDKIQYGITAQVSQQATAPIVSQRTKKKAPHRK